MPNRTLGRHERHNDNEGDKQEEQMEMESQFDLSRPPPNRLQSLPRASDHIIPLEGVMEPEEELKLGDVGSGAVSLRERTMVIVARHYQALLDDLEECFLRYS